MQLHVCMLCGAGLGAHSDGVLIALSTSVLYINEGRQELFIASLRKPIETTVGQVV